MTRALATPDELRVIGAKMETLRNELMKHAHTGAVQAGFQSNDTCALATMMALILSAQRYALQSRQHYHIFKTICSDMAKSEADAVVTRALDDIGPEATGGQIIRP